MLTQIGSEDTGGGCPQVCKNPWSASVAAVMRSCAVQRGSHQRHVAVVGRRKRVRRQVVQECVHQRQRRDSQRTGSLIRCLLH